jgi:hypothetical protein
MSADSQVWIGGISGLDRRLRKDYSHRGAELPGGGMKWSDPSVIADDNPRRRFIPFRAE